MSQNHSIIPHQEPSQEPLASSASSPTQKQTLTIHPKELNESGKDNPTWVGGGSPAFMTSIGFIPYTLGVSPLSDMKLIGNRIPEKIVIPVDISDIYFSVKTASIFPERLNIIMLTWAQTVPIDQVIGVNVIFKVFYYC